MLEREAPTSIGGGVCHVSADDTIGYVGIAGRTAKVSKVKETGSKEIVKVDFEKYISGDDDYNWKS